MDTIKQMPPAYQNHHQRSLDAIGWWGRSLTHMQMHSNSIPPSVPGTWPDHLEEWALCLSSERGINATVSCIQLFLPLASQRLVFSGRVSIENLNEFTEALAFSLLRWSVTIPECLKLIILLPPSLHHTWFSKLESHADLTEAQASFYPPSQRAAGVAQRCGSHWGSQGPGHDSQDSSPEAVWSWGQNERTSSSVGTLSPQDPALLLGILARVWVLNRNSHTWRPSPLSSWSCTFCFVDYCFIPAHSKKWEVIPPLFWAVLMSPQQSSRNSHQSPGNAPRDQGRSAQTLTYDTRK